MGRTARTRPEVHLCKIVLVVQHVFHGGLFNYAAPDVSSGWAEGVRYLYLALFGSSRDQKRFRRVPFRDILGACRRRANTARPAGGRFAMDSGIRKMD